MICDLGQVLYSTVSAVIRIKEELNLWRMRYKSAR